MEAEHIEYACCPKTLHAPGVRSIGKDSVGIQGQHRLARDLGARLSRVQQDPVLQVQHRAAAGASACSACLTGALQLTQQPSVRVNNWKVMVDSTRYPEMHSIEGTQSQSTHLTLYQLSIQFIYYLYSLVNFILVNFILTIYNFIYYLYSLVLYS